MKRAFLAMALALLACEQSPTTIKDTEGRVFLGEPISARPDR